MATKKRALSSENAPDPARSYERARPEDEAGMGKLDVPAARRSRRADRMHQAVGNRQEGKQLNNDDVVNTTGGELPK